MSERRWHLDLTAEQISTLRMAMTDAQAYAERNRREALTEGGVAFWRAECERVGEVYKLVNAAWPA